MLKDFYLGAHHAARAPAAAGQDTLQEILQQMRALIERIESLEEKSSRKRPRVNNNPRL